MADVDLNAVAAFAGVLEAGSFRAAAAALRVPRSTVSRKIAELEDRLGVRLLERTTRSVRLTDAGAEYQRQVVPALEALRQAERSVSLREAAPSGRLRMTAPDADDPVLQDALAEYLRRYPAVELEVEITNRRVDLLAEGFDLAVRAGPLADSTLVARALGQPVRAVLVASAAYLRRRGTPRRVEELARHDCLALGVAPHRWPLVFCGKVKDVPVRARAAASSFQLLRALALAGHGIARIPEHMAAADVRRGALRVVLEAALPPPLPLHALYPSARHLSAKVRALLDLLEARFRGVPAPR